MTVMRSIVEKFVAVERPRGVVLLAWIFFALAALMIVYGVLIAASADRVHAGIVGDRY
jgi:hypothetical protein